MATPQRSEDPMPQPVDFFFDFISPYTYLAQTQLPL
jgi:2-hydroxychromene-2-carboxylate isomerase